MLRWIFCSGVTDLNYHRNGWRPHLYKGVSKKKFLTSLHTASLHFSCTFTSIFWNMCYRTRKIWFGLDILKFHYPGQNIGSHWPSKNPMLLCKILCKCIIPVSKISFIIQVMKGNAQKHANHNPGMASHWISMESRILHENWKDMIQFEEQNNHAIALMDGVHLSSFHCYI